MSQAVNPWRPRYWFSWFWIGILHLLGWLPFPLTYALGAILGELFFLIVPARRHVTLVNLRLCLPDRSAREHRRIARRHFRLLVCSLLSIGTIWWSRESRLRRIVKVKGIEHLDKALADGHGVILLAPHFVAMDAGGMRLSMERKMSSMYQTNPNPVFDRFILRARSRFGGELIDHKAPLTRLIRSIRKGHPFYYLPDQNAGHRYGMFVPFFGVQASTFHTLGKLASTGKAVVIPCSNRIVPWKGIETVLSKPLENFPVGDDFQDTLNMNQVIERMILDGLEADYLWSHKRFKHQPEGSPDLYAK